MSALLINDLSALTNIDEKTLDKITDKIYYVINDAVLESIADKQTVTEIDVGVGTLYIQTLENEIKYKFVPNLKLEKTVRDAVITKQNLLQPALSAALSKNITTTYKDLF